MTSQRAQASIARMQEDLRHIFATVTDSIYQLAIRGEKLQNVHDRSALLLEQSERMEQRIQKKRREDFASSRLSKYTWGALVGTARGISHGIVWTGRRTRAFLFLVLYYLGKMGSMSKSAVKTLFPIEGLSPERYAPSDIYHAHYLYESEHAEDEEEEDLDEHKWEKYA